jgi:hypothetical protein
MMEVRITVSILGARKGDTPELTQLGDEIHGIHVVIGANNKLSASLMNSWAAFITRRS